MRGRGGGPRIRVGLGMGGGFGGGAMLRKRKLAAAPKMATNAASKEVVGLSTKCTLSAIPVAAAPRMDKPAEDFSGFESEKPIDSLNMR